MDLFLQVFLQHRAQLFISNDLVLSQLYQLFCSSLGTEELGVYYSVPGTNCVSWEVKQSHSEGAAGLTQAGLKLSNQCQQLKNRSSNSSSRGSGMGDWKDGDKCAGTSEETEEPPDGQATSELTHCWQHLPLNGTPPWGHQSVCSSVEAEII